MRKRIIPNPKDEETRRALLVIEAIGVRDMVSEAYVLRQLGATASTSSLTKLKHGKTSIQIDQVKKLEDVFKVNFDYIMGKSEKMFLDEHGLEPKTVFCNQFCDLLEGFKDQIPSDVIMKHSIEGGGTRKIEAITLSFIKK